MRSRANERAGGKGGFAPLVDVVHSSSALPQRGRWAAFARPHQHKPKTRKENAMKKANVTRHIVRAAVLGLLASTLPTALVVLHAADNPTSAAAPSPLAKELIGTWILVGKPGEVGEAPAVGGRLKFFTGRHWTITQADPKTGVTIFHHGGTYALKGNEYLETVEYANESNTNLIGQTFKFTIKVQGDTLTQTGIGNPWTEVWKRAK